MDDVAGDIKDGLGPISDTLKAGARVIDYAQKREEREKEKKGKKEELKREREEMLKLMQTEQRLVALKAPIRAIQNHVANLWTTYQNLENAITNLQVILSGVIEQTFQHLQTVMQFREYRQKRDNLLIVEEMIDRYLTYGEFSSLADLRFECQAKRPEDFLIWLDTLVVDTKIEPNLLPAIIKYSQRFGTYRQWLALIIGDAYKCVGYQFICNSVDERNISETVRKDDYKFAWRKFKSIEKVMLEPNTIKELIAETAYNVKNHYRVDQIIV